MFWVGKLSKPQVPIRNGPEIGVDAELVAQLTACDHESTKSFNAPGLLRQFTDRSDIWRR